MPRARDVILELLWDGPKYGRELVEKSNGRLHRGSVYVYLAELEAEGTVRATPEVDPVHRIPRRRYSITEGGRRALVTGTPEFA